VELLAVVELHKAGRLPVRVVHEPRVALDVERRQVVRLARQALVDLADAVIGHGDGVLQAHERLDVIIGTDGTGGEARGKVGHGRADCTGCEAPTRSGALVPGFPRPRQTYRLSAWLPARAVQRCP
jgi:hypothetical protein